MSGTDDGLVAYTLEDLKGQTPEALRMMVEKLDEKIRTIHQTESGELRDTSDAEDQAIALCIEVRAKAMAKIEEHRAITEVLTNKPKSVSTSFGYGASGDDPLVSVRGLSVAEARDRALRVLDSRDASADLRSDQKDQVERFIRRDTDMARRILVTEHEDYRTAWMKMVTRTNPIFTDEERRAVLAYDEYRAMSENTTTAGGYGIPVFIDPSIILTAQGSGNPFLSIARQVNVNTNQWKGVSSAGVSWAFQTEAATVADNSPTLAQPTVQVHMARGFIPYSIEVGDDYPAFAAEMSTLLAEGYDELLVDKFTRGSGSGEPTGIVTALSANTNVRVMVTTSGSLGSPDPYKVWKAVPQRNRRKASWLMSVGVNNAVRQIGAANVFHGYTVNLPEEWADQLMGAAVYEDPYMADTAATTTSNESLAVVGDFSNFVVARNGGMSVEFVPQLFQQVTAGSGPARPTGQRGWFAYARIGSNSVNDLAFRLLTNVT